MHQGLSQPLCPSRPTLHIRTLAFSPSPAYASSKGGNPPPMAPGLRPVQSLTTGERAAEVAVATTSSLINGAVIGAIFGLISGGWNTRSLGGAFAEARTNARSWALISAVYAGLQTAAKVVRNREDRFNSVIGACGSGATLTAKGGPSAALQGCASVAALSYLIETFTAPHKEDKNSDEAILRKR